MTKKNCAIDGRLAVEQDRTIPPPPPPPEKFPARRNKKGTPDCRYIWHSNSFTASL